MNKGIRAYQQQGDLERRRKQEEQLRQYAPLVRRVAYRLVNRLPASVDVDDLISVGTIGLLHAMEHFDASKGTRFEAFAEFRIKGAMLDELRQYDFMSRAVRGRSNRLQRAVGQLETRLGRTPTAAELAAETGIPEEEVEPLLAEAGQMALVTLDDLVVPTDQTEVASELLTQAPPEDPFGHTFFKELRDEVASALGTLPERLQMILSLYYVENLNFKEIGKVLDVTESRISQLHREAVEGLRKRLRAAL